MANNLKSSVKMSQGHKIFYGWYIVGLAIVSMMLIYGIRSSFSIFFQPILEEFHWSRGSISLMLSLNILVYGLFAPFAGSLGDRWKPRRMVMIGAVILGLATAGCGFANQIWHFYLLFGVISPIGTACCGTPLLTPAISNWFSRRRQLAISMGQIGGGLSFAYGLLAETVISHLGWRPAYFVLAAILLAILLPLYFFVFHHRPSDKGLVPDGGTVILEESNKVIPRQLTSKNWDFKSAIRSYRLWMLVLADFFYWGLGNYLVIAHQVKFAQDAGYSSLFATSVFALFGIVSIAGQIAAPIADWIGREKTVTFASILAIGALLALISVHDTSQPWLLYAYAVCSGFATGLFSPTIFTGVADIFYGRSYGAISSLLLTGVGIGGAIGPWLGGYIFDITNSYFTAFIISIAGFGLACICFWVAAPRREFKARSRMSR